MLHGFVEELFQKAKFYMDRGNFSREVCVDGSRTIATIYFESLRYQVLVTRYLEDVRLIFILIVN